MDYTQLIDSAAEHVKQLFAEKSESAMVYHNLNHTTVVAAKAAEIAAHYKLGEEEIAIVEIAAWFHDTGYLSVPDAGHEAESVAKAQAFLKQNNAPSDFIEKVSGAILATRMPQKPEGLLEAIVCDADLYHLGTKDFDEANKNIRKEVEIQKNTKISGAIWRAHAIQLLKDHEYHTDYCRKELDKQKEKNLKKQLKKQLKKAAADVNGKEGEKEKPRRGIETMFRTTATNHVRFSEMADQKAHIMITVNSIIISILVSSLFRKLQEDSRLLIPALMMTFTSLTAIVFAILATRPNVTSGRFTKDDIKNKTANLLFFGNFYKMSIDDYTWGVNEMRKDAEFLYSSLTRDIYNLGVVLGKKYKLLRIGYSIFMFGFIASAMAFVMAITLF